MKYWSNVAFYLLFVAFNLFFYLPYLAGVHSACLWSYRCPNPCGFSIPLHGAGGPAG